MKIKPIISIVLLIILFSACYAIPDSLSFQETVYDDYGKVITEDEINGYTNPNVFSYTLQNMVMSTAIGMGISMVYIIATYNTANFASIVSCFAGGIVGGLWLGFSYSSIFPPNSLTRNEAIDLIKQNRIKEREKLGNF